MSFVVAGPTAYRAGIGAGELGAHPRSRRCAQSSRGRAR